MSEALTDEVEAINSIYGENTLVPSTEDHPSSPEPTYILTLPTPPSLLLSSGSDNNPEPGSANVGPSIRLQFPATYPDVPPLILSVHSSGSLARKRGAAAADLSLFRTAVSETYEPGQVCLFDAIEKYQELVLPDRRHTAPPDDPPPDDDDDDDQEEKGEFSDSSEGEKNAAAAAAARFSSSSSSARHHQHNQNQSEQQQQQQLESSSINPPPPPWTISAPVIELRSTFVARACAVSSPQQAASYVRHLVATDKRVRSATHNMTAWRIRGPNGTSYQDCDDDGEAAAGGRLLHLMQLMDLWDVMVVVTRWYGGQKLGPRRFALINQAARDAFVRMGVVKGEGGGSASASGARTGEGSGGTGDSKKKKGK